MTPAENSAADQAPVDLSKYSDKTPNFFWSLFTLRCPRCRRGGMFLNKTSFNNTKNMAMPERCPVCGQLMDIEVGFYYGTGYVSYALCVAVGVTTFVAGQILFGIHFADNSIFIWMGTYFAVLALTYPYLMRLSRTIWLAFFVGYDKHWKDRKAADSERVIKEHMNNW